VKNAVPDLSLRVLIALSDRVPHHVEDGNAAVSLIHGYPEEPVDCPTVFHFGPRMDQLAQVIANHQDLANIDRLIVGREFGIDRRQLERFIGEGVRKRGHWSGSDWLRYCGLQDLLA
jgi:hypothetical protein